MEAPTLSCIWPNSAVVDGVEASCTYHVNSRASERERGPAGEQPAALVRKFRKWQSIHERTMCVGMDKCSELIFDGALPAQTNNESFR
jgi:hypothetical protein